MKIKMGDKVRVDRKGLSFLQLTGRLLDMGFGSSSTAIFTKNPDQEGEIVDIDNKYFRVLFPKIGKTDWTTEKWFVKVGPRLSGHHLTTIFKPDIKA